MPLQEFTVLVTQTVTVMLDTDTFTEEFLQKFRNDFYDFDRIEEHACHIAQLQARGVIDIERPGSSEFIEGYGFAHRMGLSARVIETDVNVIASGSDRS